MIGDEGRPIAAIATAAGPAGIAVIRISGESALTVADRVIQSRRGRKASTQAAGSFFHAHFIHPATGLALDDGLVLVFRSPASFTGEDTVELHGHGGRMASGQVLEAVLVAGASLAAPGEFTRRAFVNGRMDLTQAEAVMDVVHARSNRAALAARAQLDGRLGRLVNSSYDEILDMAADVAAWLDLDEGTVDDAKRQGFAARLDQARKTLSLLLATWREGHCLREGAMMVIAGMPNAGKSSLLNALLGTHRAIVSAIPGTTRDTIEENIIVDGISARLVDTAGIRDSPCMIEREGVERTMTCISQADVVIYLCDATQPLEPQITSLMTVMKRVNCRAVIVALNKTDVPSTCGIIELEALLTKHHLDIDHISISALNGEGLDGLRVTISKAISVEVVGEPHAVVSERHRGELLSAMADIDTACPLVNDDSRLFMVADHLRRAAEAIGRISGRVYDEELLDRVFARFCVGK